MVFFTRSKSLASSVVLAAGLLQATAFDNSRSDNLAVYYGQNSYAAAGGSGAQPSLSTFCEDDTINAIPLAFLSSFFSTGGLPEFDMASTCSASGDPFPGTSIANCQFMADQIKACQAKGKIITVSLGGATGDSTFTSDAQGEQFADTIWNLFLGGTSSTRPFGTAVLDGIDLDIEGGGSTVGFAAFVNKIRSHAKGASKQYYVTAAPQCVFPDANLGPILNAVAFDAIYVQFYNNYCGVQNYDNANAWNFGTWDNWAKTQAINKDVKVYIGAPASSTAAGSGYISASALGQIAKDTRAKYSSFGGVMLWDASQAYANNHYDKQIKTDMGTGSATGSNNAVVVNTTSTKATSSMVTATATSTQTTTATSTSTSTTGSCATVSAWNAATTYVASQQSTYNGHLWAAKWWTVGEVPGTVSDAPVWADQGACTNSRITRRRL